MKAMSGFGGKGFKFDETEAQLVSERKKLQKAALGLEDSDDEDPSMDVSRVSHSLYTVTCYNSKSAYEPCHEKTCLWGFRPGRTQTGLYSLRRWLEA